MDLAFELVNTSSWLIAILYMGLSVWISRLFKDKVLFFFLITGGFTFFKIFRYFFPNIGYANHVSYFFATFAISFPLFTLTTALACFFSISSIVLFLLKRHTRLSVFIALFSNIILFLTSAIYMHVDWGY